MVQNTFIIKPGMTISISNLRAITTAASLAKAAAIASSSGQEQSVMPVLYSLQRPGSSTRRPHNPLTLRDQGMTGTEQGVHKIYCNIPV